MSLPGRAQAAATPATVWRNFRRFSSIIPHHSSHAAASHIVAATPTACLSRFVACRRSWLLGVSTFDLTGGIIKYRNCLGRFWKEE